MSQDLGECELERGRERGEAALSTYSPRLCSCPKCINKSSPLTKRNTHHILASSTPLSAPPPLAVAEERHPSYEESVQSDIFEVGRIIQCAMAASGMKALPPPLVPPSGRSSSSSESRQGYTRPVTTQPKPQPQVQVQVPPSGWGFEQADRSQQGGGEGWQGSSRGQAKWGVRGPSGKNKKSFMDAETDRISKIMLGSMMKYSGGTAGKS